MPEPPHSYFPATATVGLDLSAVAEKVTEHETRRQQAFDFGRKLQAALTRAEDAVWNGAAHHQAEAMDSLDALMQNEIWKQDESRKPRLANLSMRMEEYVRLQAFAHFLQTARLLPPPALATDEEYLAGACMGLTQALQRYGLGRATARDVASVQAAATLASDILNFLLQLDFRNGPLRRKYDGCKWSLRSLETLLYELAITSSSSDDSSTAAAAVPAATKPQTKKAKHESVLLPNDALRQIQQRMEARDALRETLIKQCRDGQKAAKQSIFALHRGDAARALELLAQCHACLCEKLLPAVQQEPSLRQGAFANVLEEFVEAKLFATWLGCGDAQQKGTVLALSEFGLALEPEEYVGGLCDLTGEVGRYAVQRGTVRDVPGVQLCLQTNQAVLSGLQMMEHWPAGTAKKLDAVRRSVEKLQRMLYEMSLSEAAGGRHVTSEAADAVMEEAGGDKGDS